MTEYAEKSAHALRDVLKSRNNLLPGSTKSIPKEIITPLPSETPKTLTDFIECSDPPFDVSVLQSTISAIQIHNSRLRRFVREDGILTSATDTLLRTEAEARIIDAASIYAGAAAMYRYARRQSEQLPSTLSWGAVRMAWQNMGMWPEDFQNIEALFEVRERASVGPFGRQYSGQQAPFP